MDSGWAGLGFGWVMVGCSRVCWAGVCRGIAGGGNG